MVEPVSRPHWRHVEPDQCGVATRNALGVPLIPGSGGAPRSVSKRYFDKVAMDTMADYLDEDGVFTSDWHA